MDKIIIGSNTDMQRVIDWSEKLSGMAIELPFAEAEIEFQDELITLRFRDEGSPVVFFEAFMGEQSVKVVSWRCDLAENRIMDLNICTGDPTKKAQLAMLLTHDNTVWKCVRKFRAVMLFAAYYREEINSTKEVRRSAYGASTGGKTRSNKRKLVTTRRYTINNSMLSELPEPKKGWQGYKETFAVRGHFRKTKNGKTVWVRPYQKQGISDKKTDKQYVL